MIFVSFTAPAIGAFLEISIETVLNPRFPGGVGDLL
jgi:hypothetical protein